MKVFGTHLPVMPRNEKILLLGQTERRLSIGWRITRTTEQSVATPNLAISADRAIVSLTCQIIDAPEGDAEMRVTFNEGAQPTAATEDLVANAMATIHGTLVMLLGGPGIKMWMLTSGQWVSGVKFSS
jgi:hypothetical protein